MEGLEFSEREEKVSYFLKNVFIFKLKKIKVLGVPFMVQWLKNPARIHEDGGSIPGLTQWGWGSCVAVAVV